MISKEVIKETISVDVIDLVDFFGDDIKQAIETGEITVDEIGAIFTECLRFALA